MIRKFNILYLVSLLFILNSCATQKQTKPKWTQNPKIEIVNSQTVIFRDVVKVEMFSNNPYQITYVYDLIRFKPVKTVKGTFTIDLKRGDYLIQSNRKITKTYYDVMVE